MQQQTKWRQECVTGNDESVQCWQRWEKWEKCEKIREILREIMSERNNEIDIERNNEWDK